MQNLNSLNKCVCCFENTRDAVDAVPLESSVGSSREVTAPEMTDEELKQLHIRYRNTIYRTREKLTCGRCNDKVLPAAYTNHLIKVHKVKARLVCVWCLEYRWSDGDNISRTVHRLECLDNRLKAEKAEQEKLLKQKMSRAKINQLQKLRETNQQRLDLKRRHDERDRNCLNLAEARTFLTNLHQQQLQQNLAVNSADSSGGGCSTEVGTSSSTIGVMRGGGNEGGAPSGPGAYTGEIVTPATSGPKAEIQVTEYLFNSCEAEKFVHKERAQLYRKLESNQKRNHLVKLYDNLEDYNKPKPDWLCSLDGVKAGIARKCFLNELQMDARFGFDAFYQRAFLFKTNLVWYHVSIRFCAWKSFINDFWPQHKDKMYFLPHWCLCSGGREHHRHMICVLLEQDKALISRDFAKMVKSDGTVAEITATTAAQKLSTSKSDLRINCKFKREIKNSNPLHLLNTIKYLSNKSSTCLNLKTQVDAANENLNLDDDGICSFNTHRVFNRRTHKLGSCHYYINQPVFKYIDLFGMLYKPNGLLLYLDAKCRNRVPADALSMARNPKTKRWSVAVHDMVDPSECNLIFPLADKCLQFEEIVDEDKLPSSADNNKSFIFVGNKIFNVVSKLNLKNLEQREWNNHQLNTNNRFIHLTDPYYLGTKGQDFMNRFGEIIFQFIKVIAEDSKLIAELKDKCMHFEQQLQLQPAPPTDKRAT